VKTFASYNEIIIFEEQLCTVCPIWIFILDTVQAQIYSMVQKLEHFPLSNFPVFPGRNAFVEVSGRGGGDPFHIQAIQVCWRGEVEHFRNNII
jgi:hypothetical protein